MCEQTSEDQNKVVEYLSVIQDRILAPLEKTEIRSFCTASLLLLFAAMDGLGKLLDPNDKARPVDRIYCFLDFMGGDYRARKKELWKLRNSLVHNAINVESFLSHTEMGADQHLKKMGAAGFIYVNTAVMYSDFVNAFERFRAEIQRDPARMKRAADRLVWRGDNTWNDQVATNVPTPSLPPPVQFIYAE